MKNILTILILCRLAGCTPAVNPKPATTKNSNAPLMITPQDSAVDEKLESRISFAQFQSIAFASAIDQWSAVAGVKVLVDWDSLRAAAVNPTTPVSVTLKNVRLAKALQQILASLPIESYAKKLAYCIDRGQILITTNQQLEPRRVSRSYDVSDLMMPTTRDPMDQIKRYLTQSVDALSWDDNVDVLSWQDAGAAGEKHVLVIVQLPEVQWKIQESLASLRAGMNGRR